MDDTHQLDPRQRCFNGLWYWPGSYGYETALEAEIERLRKRDARFVAILKHFGLEFQEDLIADLVDHAKCYTRKDE